MTKDRPFENRLPRSPWAVSENAPQRKCNPWYIPQRHTAALDLLLPAISDEVPIFSFDIPQPPPDEAMLEHNNNLARMNDDVCQYLGMVLEWTDDIFRSADEIRKVLAYAAANLSNDDIATLQLVLPIKPETFNLVVAQERASTEQTTSLPGDRGHG